MHYSITLTTPGDARSIMTLYYAAGALGGSLERPSILVSRAGQQGAGTVDGGPEFAYDTTLTNINNIAY